MIFWKIAVLLAVAGLSAAHEPTLPDDEPILPDDDEDEPALLSPPSRAAHTKEIHFPPIQAVPDRPVSTTPRHPHVRGLKRGTSKGPAPDPPPTARHHEHYEDVVLQVLHDNFPWEVSWQFMNEYGSIIASQCADCYYVQNGMVREEMQLTHGTYYFDIQDTMCDGLCCGYGNGGYSIQVNDMVVASGGDYGCWDSSTIQVGHDDNNPNVRVSIDLDRYPEDTGWHIVDDRGLVWAAVSPGSYTNRFQTVSEDLALSVGSYTFTIVDSWGDGIGMGRHRDRFWVDVNGVTRVSGAGNFGTQYSQDFYVSSF